MSVERHPLAQLSAHLDGALSPADRAAVDAHLDACAACRARLAELRATARLIGSLPDLAPTRRLIPRVALAPAWLAPLRTMTTLASGLSVFLFLATALLANIGGLATTTSSGAAAPAPAALQASAAPSAASRGVQVPAVAPSAPSAADAAKAAPSGAPSPQAGAAASAGAAFATSPQAPAEVAARSDNAQPRVDRSSSPMLASPWLWLGLAIVFAIVAIALQRRLRSA